MRRVLLFVMSFLFSALGSGCALSGSEINRAVTQQKAETHLNWTDSEWSLAPVAQLPSEGNSRRLRCNKNALCWSWDEHSVWVSTQDASWRLFHHSADKRVQSAYLHSSTSGWIVKDRVLYKTDDGGTTLKQASVGEGSSILSVFFADENNGWAAGAKLAPMQKEDAAIPAYVERGQIRLSQIYVTANGGVTWKEATLPRVVGDLDEITLSDQGTGIAANRRNLFFTNNRGATWLNLEKHFPKLEEGEHGSFVSAFLPGGNRAWLLFVGLEYAAWSTDNGLSWKESDWEIQSKSTDTAAFPPPARFIFVDDQHGLLLNNHTYDCEVFKTSDGGKTWSAIQLQANGEERFLDLVVQSPKQGLLVSNKGVYRFSLQDGR